MTIDHNFFMQLAISEAWKYQGLTLPNPAVSCVITRGNEVLAIEAHQEAGKPHAEVLALQSAFFYLTADKEILALSSSEQIHQYLTKHHNGAFGNCALYTTLEPCNHHGKTPPCSQLIETMLIKQIFFGSHDPHSKGGENRLSSVAHIEQILPGQCDDLLYPFLEYKKNSLILYKYASTLNGVTSGGYLSSEPSLQKVHAVRDKIDLLIIGGNTVRTDRPTLDARLVNGKAPDVMIYSTRDDFDKTIPLFQVPNRKVIITNDKNILKDYQYILIEGSDTLMKCFENDINLYLFYLCPKLSTASPVSIEQSFTYLYTRSNGDDIEVWAKKQ